MKNKKLIIGAAIAIAIVGVAVYVYRKNKSTKVVVESAPVVAENPAELKDDSVLAEDSLSTNLNIQKWDI